MTDVFNAKNLDTLHDTALTSDVMNVMNVDILSWTALIKYLPPNHQYHITRHIEIITTDPDCNRETGTAAIEAAEGNPIQNTSATVTEPAMTHHTCHIADHQHTTVHWVTALRTTADHIHIHPIGH